MLSRKSGRCAFCYQLSLQGFFWTTPAHPALVQSAFLLISSETLQPDRWLCLPPWPHSIQINNTTTPLYPKRGKGHARCAVCLFSTTRQRFPATALLLSDKPMAMCIHLRTHAHMYRHTQYITTSPLPPQTAAMMITCTSCCIDEMGAVSPIYIYLSLNPPVRLPLFRRGKVSTVWRGFGRRSWQEVLGNRCVTAAS